MCLSLPINQSTPALVSTTLSQSSSDLDTDWGEIIDETLKQVAQTVKQMLLKTTTGSPASNLDSSETPYINTSGRQSAPTPNTSDIHRHTTISPKNNYRPDSSEHILTNLVANFEKKAKQIIMDIDALLPPPPPYVIKSNKN